MKAAQREVSHYLQDIVMPNTSLASHTHDAIEHSNLVYLFEKSPVLSETFAVQLDEWGYEVQSFPMLDQLLAAFVLKPPSVLIVNAGLMTPAPREAITRLRRQHNFPLVFISPEDDAQARGNAVKANADACFTLPVDMPGFVKKLRQLTLVEAPQEWRLLVVDDTGLYLDQYDSTLKSAGIQTCLVDNPRTIIESLNNFAPSLALINTQLASLSGLEAAMAIRQQEDYSHLPVIFFAQAFDQTLRRAVMKGISDDYLSESISPSGLLEAVVARFDSSRQQQDRRRRDDNHHDWHTGFYTRQYLLSQLELFNRHVETPHPLCMLYIQLDNHAGVCNIMGHTIAEAVVRETAQQLHKLCQRQDLLVRYDEAVFAVLSQHRSLSDIQTLAESIRETLAKHLTVAAGQKVSTPCSIGIGLYHEAEGNPTEALTEARDACEQAWQAGGDRVQLYGADETIREEEEHTAHWQAVIRDALKENQFYLAYQPIANLYGTPNIYYDVLIRLQNEQKREGIVAAEFLSIAEQSDLILQIDRWVMEETVRALANPETDPATKFFVRLARASLSKLDLPVWLHDQLLKAGDIDFNRIIFDLSRTAVHSQLEEARQFVRELKRLGGKIVLSQFNGNAESVALLDLLDVDFVKMSSGVIQGLTDDPDQLHALKTSAEFVHSRNKTIIAPFVESTDTLNLLWQHKIDYIAGHFVQAPSPNLDYAFD